MVSGRRKLVGLIAKVAIPLRIGKEGMIIFGIDYNFISFAFDITVVIFNDVIGCIVRGNRLDRLLKSMRNIALLRPGLLLNRGFVVEMLF